MNFTESSLHLLQLSISQAKILTRLADFLDVLDAILSLNSQPVVWAEAKLIAEIVQCTSCNGIIMFRCNLHTYDSRRAGHLGFAVLQCGFKSQF